MFGPVLYQTAKQAWDLLEIQESILRLITSWQWHKHASTACKHTLVVFVCERVGVRDSTWRARKLELRFANKRVTSLLGQNLTDSFTQFLFRHEHVGIYFLTHDIILNCFPNELSLAYCTSGYEEGHCEHFQHFLSFQCFCSTTQCLLTSCFLNYCDL